MRAQRRAWRCLVRKPGKSLLLVLVMFLTSVLILGTTVVIDAVVQAEHALSAQTQARLVCESSDAEQPLTADDVSNIARLDGVQSVNRCLTANVTAEDCTPVTRSTSQTAANAALRLCGYDAPTQDGPFADGSYTLSTGGLDLAADGVLMNETLAAQNGLDVGDAITLTDASGARWTLHVAGLFHTGNEERQPAETLASERLENQLFAPAEVVAACSGAVLSTLSVDSASPENIEALAAQVRTLLGERATVTTADSLYQSLVAPLAQLVQVVKLMRSLAAVMGALVVALLLALWLRGRRQELAIFLSLGLKKRSLLAQVLWESGALCLFALAFASGSVAVAAQLWGALLAQMLGVALELRLHAETVGLFAVGAALVIVACVLTVLAPMLLRAPKVLLSRMEE